MKVLFWLAVIGGLGYLLYQEVYLTNSQPRVITDPVYGHFRVDANINGRKLKWDYLVKYTSLAECRESQKQEEPYLLKDCPYCKIANSECKDELSSRQQAMFRNEPHHVTYLAGDAGTGEERDARLIIWGLSKREAGIACQTMLRESSKSYRGKLECI